MGKVQGVSVVIGIPSFGMVSTYFLQARASMQFPLVSSAADRIILEKPIAEARNEIVEYALSMNANYIMWLDDDVIAPPDSFLKMWRHNKDIINGVYWSKSNPPMPLLFREHLQGPYWNWHAGDLIEIDAAGMGLTLVKTDVYRRMSAELGGPWYSTEFFSFPGADGSFAPPNNTEDLYFYWKAKKLGYKIWADTSIQALHYDKSNKILYGMPSDAPQAHPAWEIKTGGEKLIADLGSGPVSPVMAGEGEVVTFDVREDVKPDVICDIRRLPVPDQTFDIVYSSHTLEHFSWTDVDKVLKEWSRVLKVGGELRLIVPNLKWSAQRILDDQMSIHDMWILYGEQDYPKNFHAAGFTAGSLKSLVESLGMYENVETHEDDMVKDPSPATWNLRLKATKVTHPKIENIAPEDAVPATPPEGQGWPMRVYNTFNERPMTPEDIESDKKLVVESTAKEKKAKLVKKVKETKDGLDRAI